MGLKSLNLNLKVFSQKLDFSAFLEVHLILIFIELIISGGEVRLVTGESHLAYLLTTSRTPGSISNGERPPTQCHQQLVAAPILAPTTPHFTASCGHTPLRSRWPKWPLGLHSYIAPQVVASQNGPWGRSGDCLLRSERVTCHPE